MLTTKVKIARSIDDEKDGELPIGMIGNIYDVVKINEEGIWVDNFGEHTLLLNGEYEVIEGVIPIIHMTGNVVECEDTSRYGVYYDISGKEGNLVHLLEKYHGKTVKVTVQVIE